MIRERLKSFLTSADQKIRRVLDTYDEVMREGSYHSEPQSLISVLFNSKKRSIDTPTAVVTQLANGASKTLFKKIAIGAAIALLSTQMALGLGIGLAVFATAFKVVEYQRARKARLEIIEERNFAEQLVRGSRRDLCRLHIAQNQILNLSESFQRASLSSASDTIDNIIKSVENERSRVRVLDAGRYGMDIELYDFSEPAIKPVNYRPHMRQRKLPDNDNGLSGNDNGLPANGALKQAWGNKKTTLTEEEIVDRLVELEQGMPEHMLAEVRKRVDAAKVETPRPGQVGAKA